jgi:hypothetical protein
MKKLLILTGPQGSGNHLFSRVFSAHPDVSGWEELLTKYWVPSDQEPFAEYWLDPDKLLPDDFLLYDYYVANVSCPFFFNGMRYIPDILGVANKIKSFGIEVEIAIIVRDQNINRVQQERVRGEHTTPLAQAYYYSQLMTSDFPVHFLDHEAFFLHKEYYLKWVAKVLNFPIAYDDHETIMRFISDDANHKYVKSIDEYWLDAEVLAGCKPTRDERMK